MMTPFLQMHALFAACFWAPGRTTRSIPTTSNKKLLGAPGIATRNKDATRGSWHRY